MNKENMVQAKGELLGHRGYSTMDSWDEPLSQSGCSAQSGRDISLWNGLKGQRPGEARQGVETTVRREADPHLASFPAQAGCRHRAPQQDPGQTVTTATECVPVCGHRSQESPASQPTLTPTGTLRRGRGRGHHRQTLTPDATVHSSSRASSFSRGTRPGACGDHGKVHPAHR